MRASGVPFALARRYSTYTYKDRSWQQRWRRAAQEGAASGRFLTRSLSAGIVGVGVLLVSWPILDNVIAPVAVRLAMNSAPHGVEAFCGREEELDRLDTLLDGTNTGIWILEGVGKTSLLRMEQARRPCTYINLRETSTVNDLVFQLVTHLYQPLGGLGNLITSYTQLVHASIKLVGASDGDVYNAYQELFFSLYLTHLRRALSATTSTGPVTPCGSHLTASNSASCSAALLPASSTLQLTPLLVLDHADIAMALGQKSSEAGYQRLLDELLLLAIAVAQDTGTAQVVIATGSEGRAALEKRLQSLGAIPRRLRVAGLSKPDSAVLVRKLIERAGGARTEQELTELGERAGAECEGDPKRIQALVAREVWGVGAARFGGTVGVGLWEGEEVGQELAHVMGKGLGVAILGAAAVAIVGAMRR